MSTTSRIIRVAVVEDRREEREQYVAWLHGAQGISCVESCRSGAEALKALPRMSPDIVLMDIQMSGMSGIECIRCLRPLLPDSQFMMLTVVEDSELIFDSLKAGATGYLLKKAQPQRLLEAIRELHEGGSPMSGQVARKVIAAFAPTSASTPSIDKLSPTEQNVLEHLAQGLLYKEVADQLEISNSTVRTHIWRIYKKLHVRNRTEAVLKLGVSALGAMQNHRGRQ